MGVAFKLQAHVLVAAIAFAPAMAVVAAVAVAALDVILAVAVAPVDAAVSPDAATPWRLHSSQIFPESTKDAGC